MINKTNIHELVLNDAYFVNGGCRNKAGIVRSVKSKVDIVQCQCNYKNSTKKTNLFYMPTKKECGVTCCYSYSLGVESFTYDAGVNYPITEFCN